MAQPPDDDGLIAGFFGRSLAALQAASIDRVLHASIAAVAAAIVASLRAGGKLLIAGNGGSAADAQHLAAEFVGRFVLERQALPAIALTTDTSALTAIGNDYGFDRVFERQLRALGRRGDVLLALSTSGRSANVLTALKAARDIGLTTVGFAGSGTAPMRDLCDYFLAAPSTETAIVQQIHITFGHAICALVDRAMTQ